MIIKVYAELLGRNPSIGEFLNWYFYSGHELYKFPDHKQKEYRMTATEAALRKVIKKGPYANMSAQFKFPNKEEYEWIKAGKDPLQYPKRPKETLTKNPFSDGSLVINGQKVSYTTMNDLVKSIVDSSKDDDGKILDQTSVINDVADETTVVDDTATSEDASGNTTESSNSTTTVTERPSNMPASSDLPLDSKLNDPANKTSKVAITNDESKKTG